MGMMRRFGRLGARRRNLIGGLRVRRWRGPVVVLVAVVAVAAGGVGTAAAADTSAGAYRLISHFYTQAQTVKLATVLRRERRVERRLTPCLESWRNGFLTQARAGTLPSGVQASTVEQTVIELAETQVTLATLQPVLRPETGALRRVRRLPISRRTRRLITGPLVALRQLDRLRTCRAIAAWRAHSYKSSANPDHRFEHELDRASVNQRALYRSLGLSAAARRVLHHAETQLERHTAGWDEPATSYLDRWERRLLPQPPGLTSPPSSAAPTTSASSAQRLQRGPWIGRRQARSGSRPRRNHHRLLSTMS